MKTRKRASISISKETKEFLDSIKRPGQSYDGVIRELVISWKKNQEGEERK
jgi:predicted CopG family antitoxin